MVYNFILVFFVVNFCSIFRSTIILVNIQQMKTNALTKKTRLCFMFGDLPFHSVYYTSYQ